SDPVLDGSQDVWVLFEELLGVLAPLTEPLAAVRKPRAGLFDDAPVDREIDQITGSGDAFAVHHVEFRFTEGWRHLVLDDLHSGAAADHNVAVLDACDTPDVDPYRRVELEGAAPGRGFGVAEHDTDLLAKLVDEDQATLRSRHCTRQLA